jgi:hypothetical protein
MTTRNHRGRFSARPLEDRTVPSVVINELYVNPPGTDDNREFIELRALNGGVTPLNNVTVVEINGNTPNPGLIASDARLTGSSTGTNGLILLGPNYSLVGHPWGSAVDPATPMSNTTSQVGNDNLTVLLVEGYTGAVGQDLDVNDDGVFDVTPWTNILDSVGWLDPSVANGKVYTPAVLTQPLNTADAASRFSNDLTPNSAAAWYNGEMVLQGGTPDMTRTYDPARASTNLPSGAMITPGNVNFAAPVTTPPTKITGVTVNGGTLQRSRVTSLTVGFDQVVNLPAGDPASAFLLTRQGDGTSAGLTAAVDNSTGKSLVTLTFPGPLASATSLVDGRYTLTVFAGAVTNANGQLDGNGDGVSGDDYVLVGNTTTNKLFRLYGDADGDGDVDAGDFGAFRAAFGGTGNLAAFDADGDGDVDAGDFGAFRQRFGSSV